VKVLALHNLKGGVGKTTTAVNLAWLAAKEGARVLVWDLDPQGAATLQLGARPVMAAGAGAIIRDADVVRAVGETRFERIEAIAANLSYRMLEVELDQVNKPKKRLARILDQLRGRYDYAVIDSPPGLGLLSEAVCHTADLLLAPVIPSPIGVYAFDRMITHVALRGMEGTTAAFFNMVDQRRKVHRELIASRLGCDENFLNTIIASAADVERMGLHRAPIAAYAPKSASMQAFSALWGEVKERLAASRRIAPSTGRKLFEARA
jgi:chromosome partitioning protein